MQTGHQANVLVQWDETTQGVAQAYFGTVIPHFPNLFVMMGMRSS